MAQIELTPVVIWYSVMPGRVEARVRWYAGEIAVKEESHILGEAELTVVAEADHRTTWSERDICGLLPMPDATWAGEPVGATLKQDIALTPEEEAASIKQQIVSLGMRLEAIDPESTVAIMTAKEIAGANAPTGLEAVE